MNFTLSGFIIGLLVAGAGALALKYNFQLVNMTGHQDWIESKLGAGSTYGVYKILSVLIALGGVIYAVGLGDAVFGWLLSPFEGLFQPFKS